MTHIYGLFALLILLVLVSGFFSGSETGMMSLNRYRLRHLVRKKNRAAKRVHELLERPDRLLGVILIGNTFANVLASAIATVLAVHLFGEIGVVPATIILAIFILLFAEITPKTVAALYPEKVSFSASWLLSFLLKILYPLVWGLNTISNGFLRLFNIKVKKRNIDHLTHEEMRTIVREAMGKVAPQYQNMMLGVLDLGGITVDDIKVPRSEIVGINLEDDWEVILAQLSKSQHTRLPVYKESIDQVQGMLHLRQALNLLAQNELTKETLLKVTQEIYFIPSGTSLNIQLLNFRQEKTRIGLVVDEYGDIEGLVTLEDILEEIVGEFTTNLVPSYPNIQEQSDGSYFVDGSVGVRELNRRLDWKLPTEGPKTLSGLIIEYLEMIPPAGVGLRLAGYPMEVIQVEENMIKLVRVLPKLRSRVKALLNEPTDHE